MSQVRVAVLRGGPSDEYAISMQTGQAVLDAIDRELFNPIDIVITKNGEWLSDGYVKFPEHILCSVDVVFVALHGTYGEDGTVQRLLDRNGIRYTGSGPFASAVAMHKVTAKRGLKSLNILMPKHMVVSRDQDHNLMTILQAIPELFGPPYVIKPASSGSSIGVVFAESRATLEQQLRKSLEIFPEVIVEERITGREASCGVIENYRGERLYALPPTEIVPPLQSPFFDYQAKYEGTSEEICPGRFDAEIKQHIERIAKSVHQELDLRQFSRSDFIVNDSGIYFLEVNSLPGLTQQSIFPKAIEAVGGTYRDFVSHLLTDALER